MWAAHKKGLVSGLKTSERVMKNTIGRLKDATTNGSMNDAAWLLTYIVLPKNSFGPLITFCLGKKIFKA